MKRQQRLALEDTLAKQVITVGGLFMVTITVIIGIFLVARGIETFTVYHHTVGQFLFSLDWHPHDGMRGGGQVGAGIFIIGSLLTCGLAIAAATPLSIGTALFMTEIAPGWGQKVMQPIIELFVGIPSVVYGWIGLTILVPWIRHAFPGSVGFSVLAASIVLAIMIFPTITSITVEAFKAVPDGYRKAAYGLGSTRWQVIFHVLLPAAVEGMTTAVILGLSRAFGEALAVTMVIGKMKALPTSLLSPTSNLTSTIASDMGGAMAGGEYDMALWTMALLLFLISALCIGAIHYVAYRRKKGVNGHA